MHRLDSGRLGPMADPYIGKPLQLSRKAIGSAVSPMASQNRSGSEQPPLDPLENTIGAEADMD